MDTSTQEVGKKLWRIMKIVLYMLRKGISKTKLMSELNLMLKKGNKLAGKAIGLLTSNSDHHHHYSASSAFGCRSNDALSFVSPRSNREYEFSCSNSPAIGHAFNLKRKHHHHHNHRQHNYDFFGSLGRKGAKYDDVSTVAAVQKVLEMLNGGGDQVGASPLVMPGFGKSPMVRQLRITDSPFPLKDEGDSQLVNMAADEFIKKFYKELNSQKNVTSYLESPSYHAWWGS